MQNTIEQFRDYIVNQNFTSIQKKELHEFSRKMYNTYLEMYGAANLTIQTNDTLRKEVNKLKEDIKYRENLLK